MLPSATPARARGWVMAFRPDRFSDARVEQLRIPPQSIEAEQAVLGGLMLAPDAWARVADKVSDADFYRQDHQLIFRAIAEMAEADPPRPYDAVTLGDWFVSQEKSEVVEGGAYLIQLAKTTPSAANIGAYAEIVRDKSTLRQLIETGTGIVNDAFQPDGRDSAEILANAEQAVMGLSQRSVAGGLRRLGGLARKMWDRAVEDSQSVEERQWFTPWADVSKYFRRRLAAKLIVLAARPSVGKTAKAMQIATWNARANGKAVAVFSLEMPADELVERLACAEAEIESDRLDDPGSMTNDEWARLNRARAQLSELPIAIDDTPGMTMRDIRARARRMHQKTPGGLGLVVVDYLQLIESYDAQSREQAVSAVSRGLKGLAKELGCPVLALSQLGRAGEKEGREPVLADLRESGAIEQDADMVLILHPGAGFVHVIVAKNRGGKKGRERLSSELQFFRFKSYEPAPLLDGPPDSPAPKRRRGYGAAKDTAAAAAGER